MFKIIICSISIFAATAQAQSEDRPGARGPNNISLNAGFSKGGFNLGGAFEYVLPDNMGVGGYIHEYSKETKNTNGADGLVAVGGTISEHYYKKNWDFYLTPGVAIFSIDSFRPTPASTTTIGPSLGIGLLCQINSSVAIGFENNRYWVWFDRDYNGLLRDDFAFKVRATF